MRRLGSLRDPSPDQLNLFRGRLGFILGWHGGLGQRCDQLVQQTLFGSAWNDDVAALRFSAPQRFVGTDRKVALGVRVLMAATTVPLEYAGNLRVVDRQFLAADHQPWSAGEPDEQKHLAQVAG